jgi:hypothetical protein
MSIPAKDLWLRQCHSSKDEAWQLLSEEIGTEFVAGGFWKGGSKVQAHVGPWIVTLDTYKVRRHHHPYRHSHVTYTRMRAPFINPEGFRFTIYLKGFFSHLGKLLGMQGIKVGDPDFDEAFVIKGNDEERVRDLFANPKIRKLIQAQPKIRLEVKDSEGWFGPRFPKDVDELHFEVQGVIKDVVRLKALFDLFAAVLDQLCRIASAYKQPAGVEL